MRKNIKNRIIALVMLCAMALTLAGCGKSAAVKETERLIGAIGQVTVDSAEAVQAAEAAYEALSEEDRANVENYETLTAARTALDEAVREALRQTVLGTWEMELDLRDTLVAQLDAQFGDSGISFGDYLESYNMKMRLELKEDDTYQLTADADTMKASVENLRVATADFLEDYLLSAIGTTLEQSGLSGDFTTREGIEAAIGMDLDEAIEQSLNMKLEDYVDLIIGEIDVDETLSGVQRQGKFQVEEGKLYLSASPEQEANTSDPVDFTVDGDTLTIHVKQADAIFGSTDLQFHRAA